MNGDAISYGKVENVAIVQTVDAAQKEPLL
jgi:hypothetical protein